MMGDHQRCGGPRTVKADSAGKRRYMSFIRSERQYSTGPTMYVYPTGDHIDWAYGDPRRAEDFCEVMFRVLEQSGVHVDAGLVRQVRNRLHLPPLDQNQKWGKNPEGDELVSKEFIAEQLAAAEQWEIDIEAVDNEPSDEGGT